MLRIEELSAWRPAPPARWQPEAFVPGNFPPPPPPPPRPDVPPPVLVAVSYPYWVRLWSLRLSTCLRNTLSVRLPRAYHPSDLY